MNYGSSIKGRLHRSHRAKQAVTDGSRKNHFLVWCSRIGLPDPCCPTSPLQARNFILACYAVSLIRGETLKGDGFFIRHATLMGYISQAVRCHTDRLLPSPRTGVPIDYVSLMTDAVRKYKKVPNRREMIHDPMMSEIISRSTQTSPDSLQTALCDWIFLGGYNGFRKSEWCNDHHTKYACIEDPLWSGPDAVSFILEDFSFFSPLGVQLSDIPTLTLDRVGYSTLLHRRQKNNDNYQAITYGKCTSNPVLCPVSAMLRIAQRASRLRLPPLRPVAIYSGSSRSACRQITGKDVTSFLRSVAKTVYNLQSDSPQLRLWGPHSIRVTAANLLHRARYSDSFIKNRLRWKSDSFLMYLRNTFYTADQHSKALDIDLAPPSPMESRPLEPHEDALAAMTA